MLTVPSAHPVLSRNNSHIDLTDSRSVISPAAPLRMGFSIDNEQSDDRYLPFAERFNIDELERTNRSGLHCPFPRIQRPSAVTYLRAPILESGEHSPIETQNLLQATNG